jgi:acyl carrier protein
MTNVRGDLRRFVVDNFLFGREDASLTDDASFLERGIIDSTGVLELIDFLESHYRIKLAPDELVPENLDSIGSLTTLVMRKQPARPAAMSA